MVRIMRMVQRYYTYILELNNVIVRVCALMNYSKIEKPDSCINLPTVSVYVPWDLILVWLVNFVFHIHYCFSHRKLVSQHNNFNLSLYVHRKNENSLRVDSPVSSISLKGIASHQLYSPSYFLMDLFFFLIVGHEFYANISFFHQRVQANSNGNFQIHLQFQHNNLEWYFFSLVNNSAVTGV